MGVYAYDKEVIPYLNSNISFSKGIYVSQITKNGPAYKTELKEGDIITSIDGKDLNTMNDLREYIYSKKPNDIVSLQVSRGRVNKTIMIALRKKIKSCQINQVHLTTFYFKSLSIKLYFLIKSFVSLLFIKTVERFCFKNSII